MKKILFIIKRRNSIYGPSYGLMNSARFVSEALNKRLNVESKVVEVIDGNSIDKEVHNYKPTDVIIEALWVTPDKLHELVKLHNKVKWVVRIHSKAPFLANEGIGFEWLKKYQKMANSHHWKLFVANNNDEFNEDLKQIMHAPILYLPNIYIPAKQGWAYPTKQNRYINVGCFGAVRPLKNHLEQAVAAMIFAERKNKSLKFHVNSTRTEQRGEEVVKNLKALFSDTQHKLVEHDWQDHAEFEQTIRHMDVGMQVSMSESFNIVAADFVHNQVPIVVSHDIDWLPFGCDPTDTRQIVDQLGFAVKHKKVLTTINNIALWCYNRKALKEWKKFITKG